MTTFFEKNLNALSNEPLKAKLQAIKQSEFKLIYGKDSLDINIKDLSDGGGGLIFIIMP
ncbi:hypothetical protein [Campylobacter sp. MIT 19-121]|uniref:hypothetical protein n=1 Tax=Campylobacter sp. MIT 19-121 TaxID=2703906 RepID=UPI003082762B